MSDKKLKMNLPSVDDLFTTQEQRDGKVKSDVIKIPIDKISDFKNHPYKIINDESMHNLVQSIKERGLAHATIVRPKEDGTYEMISGHRRKYAAKLAGLKEIEAIVKNLDDDEATILMVDSNIQREEVLPSERAFAIKMKLEAMKHQGKKVDLFQDDETSVQNGQKSENQFSRDVIGEAMGISGAMVRRYVRLTELIPELLEKVDNKELGISQAEHLSFLDDDSQYLVWNKMEYDQMSPSLGQAVKLKKVFQEGNLTEERLEEIMDQAKPNQKDNQHIKYKEIKKYFPKEFTNEQIYNVVRDLLKEYYFKWYEKEKFRDDEPRKNDAR